MNEDQVSDILVDWTTSLLSVPNVTADQALQAGYSYLSSQKGPLPDVMATVEQKRISRGAEERLFFPLQQIQQASLRVFECQLAFLVESAATPSMASDEAETRLLRLYGATVEESAQSDASLGQRLVSAFISPVMLFDYRLPFIQYQDGTRGRQMTVVCAVAELIQEKETM